MMNMVKLVLKVKFLNSADASYMYSMEEGGVYGLGANMRYIGYF